MPAPFEGRRRRLAEEMERRGSWPSRSPWVRAAVDAVARDRYAPTRLWYWDGHAYLPVDRERDPDRWADEVYGDPDAAAVAQLTGGRPSSSLSCQNIVVDMLDSLLLEPGHTVLELGTGSGWTAALLAHRVGARQVTSVEIDARLADTARFRLPPEMAVITGDGDGGWAPGAPYDRVIAAYAVDRVPWEWVAQTRPGGRIVTPWGRLGHLALTVADDGRSASGWVQGLAQFLPARGLDHGTGDYGEIRGHGPAEEERPWGRDLTPLRDDWHLRFALRVALPELWIAVAEDADGLNAWLHDGVASWAALSAVGDGTTVAYQGGPRRLADELEGAWETWREAGAPELYDFGVTVREGEQFAWACDPEKGPRFPV
ncbi:methyltransferase domain-containing protein [Streptomyces sp. NPDC057638]|uniref:methyltransferase domain-containing protein n=1 Tax=Streptomyces sp. NPDC057638 TaxID=3346190 RepID=UPI00367AAFAD